MGTITDKRFYEDEEQYQNQMSLADHDLSESINLHYFLGTLIAGTLLKDYVGGLNTVAKEKKSNYLVNKTASCEKELDLLMSALNHKMKVIGADKLVENEIQWNFNLIYDVLSLPQEQQCRIKQLINKIKKGK